jgi:hypothetical protein
MAKEKKKTYHWCRARNGIKLEKETGVKADTKNNSRTKLAMESEHKTTEKNSIVAELENNRLLNSKSEEKTNSAKILLSQPMQKLACLTPT